MHLGTRLLFSALYMACRGKLLDKIYAHSCHLLRWLCALLQARVDPVFDVQALSLARMV